MYTRIDGGQPERRNGIGESTDNSGRQTSPSKKESSIFLFKIVGCDFDYVISGGFWCRATIANLAEIVRTATDTSLIKTGQP